MKNIIKKITLITIMIFSANDTQCIFWGLLTRFFNANQKEAGNKQPTGIILPEKAKEANNKYDQIIKKEMDSFIKRYGTCYGTCKRETGESEYCNICDYFYRDGNFFPDKERHKLLLQKIEEEKKESYKLREAAEAKFQKNNTLGKDKEFWLKDMREMERKEPRPYTDIFLTFSFIAGIFGMAYYAKNFK